MKEEINNQIDLKEIANNLFGKIYAYNTALLKKSNTSSPKNNCEEVFDFFITSNALVFLINIFFEMPASKGMLLSCRSIIEGFAVKRMFQQGKISKKQCDLLELQASILERRAYWKFKDIPTDAIYSKEIEDNYKADKAKIVEMLKGDFSEKQINDILCSNIPFLCDPSISYSKLVEQYLDCDLLKVYKLLSIIIHPNPNIEFSYDFLASAVVVILKLIEQEYSKLPEVNYSLEKHFLMTTASYESRNFFTAIKKISYALEDVKTDFEKNFGNNYVSNTMELISTLFEDIALDRLLGFTEQVKCKAKPLIEILASFYTTYMVDNDPPNRYSLFLEHTKIVLNLSLGKEVSFDNAYAIYEKLYSKHLNKDEFEKAFMAPTGYTINEKGKSLSINAMVRNLAFEIKEDKEKLTFSDTLMVDYVEAQMLSHANGYMWFANKGAFSDTNNVILETFYLLAHMFESLQSFFNDGYKETKEYKLRKTSNVLRDAAKEIYKCMKAVDKLQKKPMIEL